MGNAKARVFYVSQMSRVFFHIVIHGLGFLICFMIERKCDKKQQNTLFLFYTLIKHGFLTNQSARKVLSKQALNKRVSLLPQSNLLFAGRNEIETIISL